LSDDEASKNQIKEDYETVNEDLTSDTTEAPSQATKRTELAEGGGASPAV
jgi:hypothetical protein